jgi:hypothetical protein
MLFGLPQEPVRPSPQRTLSQRKSVIDRFLWKPSDDTMLHVLTPDGIAPQTKQVGCVLLQTSKNFTRFPVTSNVWTHVWSIKYK